MFSRFDQRTVALTTLTGIADTWFAAPGPCRTASASPDATWRRGRTSCAHCRPGWTRARRASWTCRSSRRWWPACGRRSRGCKANW